MSKELFFEMREEQISKLYDSTFTKKEAKETGVNLAKSILDNGVVNKHEALANLVRLQEVINNAVATIKDDVIFDKTEVLGVSFTPTNGRTTFNFKEDEIYATLEKELKERADLLKLALKQDVIDAYGNDVPKISTGSAKSSLTIKF